MEKPGYMPMGMLVAEKPANGIVGSAKNPCTETPGMIRGQAGCLVLGRGAGIAAAVAARSHVPVNAVDINHVQAELRRQHAVLEV